MVYEHLRQIPNTPFHITPDEPADPRDCARYPDSLYCGGNPFTKTPVGLDPEIVNDKCAKGVKVTPVLGFVKLPPVEVIYIEPRCRPPAPPPGAGEPKIPSGDGLCPGGEFVGFNGDLLQTCAGDGELIGYRARIVVSRQYPYGSGNTQDYYQVSRWVSWDPDPLTRNVYQCKFQIDNQIIVIGNIGGIVRYQQEDVDNGLGLRWEIQGICDPAFIPGPPPPPDVPPPPPPPPKKCDCMGCCPSNPQQDKSDRDLEEIKRLLRLLLQRVGEAQPIKIFDINPDKKGEQSKTLRPKDIAEALKIATEQVNRANEMIGIDSFPIDAPDTVIKPEKSGIWAKVFDFIIPDKRRKITSLAELVAWQTEQQAATMGSWHQVIEVEDIDPSKEGKQYKKIVLPNVAETMKESIVLQTEILKSLNLMFDVQLKTLVEASSTKLDAAKASAVAADIQEYLDYDTKKVIHEIPIQIQIPGKDLTQEEQANLVRFLQPSKSPVVVEEWTGKHAFSEIVTDLLQAARMISANFFSRQ